MLKKLLKKHIKDLEYFGDESSRKTYEGELNYASGKVFFITYLTLIAWLPYIPNDLSLHHYPVFAITCRLLLSVLSIITIILKKRLN